MAPVMQGLTSRERDAVTSFASGLGLPPEQERIVVESITSAELRDTPRSELLELFKQRAAPFLAMKLRRQERERHGCQYGRGGWYVGNGRCPRCDGYHGQQRPRR